MVVSTLLMAAYRLRQKIDVDTILLALIWNDRKQGRPIRVYPAMLSIFVAVQAPTFFLYKLPAWREFAQWYAALPLP